MRIYGQPLIFPNKTGMKVKVGDQQVESVKGKTKIRKDKVQVSEKAKKFQKIQEELIKLDHERELKIQALKQAVESGEYNVSGEKVAEKIINESIVPPLPRI